MRTLGQFVRVTREPGDFVDIVLASISAVEMWTVEYVEHQVTVFAGESRQVWKSYDRPTIEQLGIDLREAVRVFHERRAGYAAEMALSHEDRDLIFYGFWAVLQGQHDLREGQRHINARLDRIEQEEHVMSEQQADIDAAVATLGVDVSALNDSSARIEAALTALEGQGVDTTELRAAITSLDTAVGNVGNIVPVPAAGGDTGTGAQPST